MSKTRVKRPDGKAVNRRVVGCKAVEDKAVADTTLDEEVEYI